MRASRVFGLILLASLAMHSGADDATLPPPTCTKPAPLVNQYDVRTPTTWIRLSTAPAQVASVIARLTRQYAIVRPVTSPSFNGFVATLTPSQVSKLRCDPDVATMEFDQFVSIAADK